jgi:hypothetical protein
MLTVEIKLNGQTIASAKLVNQSNLAYRNDYSVVWNEQREDNLRITGDQGRVVIEQHRRRQTVWALVAKAAAAILGQMVDRVEQGERPGQALIWEQAGPDCK